MAQVQIVAFPVCITYRRAFGWGFIGFVRRHNPEKDLGFADTHNTLRIEEGGMGSQERDGLPGKTGEVSGPDLAPAFFAAGDTVRRG